MTCGRYHIEMGRVMIVRPGGIAAMEDYHGS
jgi:hypothetical protein